RLQRGPQVLGRARSGVRGEEAPLDQSDRQEVEDHGTERVQSEAGQMIAPGRVAPEGVLRLEKHPGKGLVNAQMAGRPGPAETGPGQALKVRIGVDVVVIVP